MSLPQTNRNITQLQFELVLETIITGNADVHGDFTVIIYYRRFTVCFYYFIHGLNKWVFLQ